MGFFDRLFGRGDDEEQRRQQEQSRGEQQRRQDELRRGSPYATRPIYQGQGQPGQPQQLTDEQAVERYRYMLQTAPPETIEEAHAEAFGKLTPEQRQMVLGELSKSLPENERRAGAQYSDDPRSLARMATRAEMRQPGTMERTMNGVGNQGIGMGGLMAGSFFSSFAGMMVGSMVASAFFGGFGGDGSYSEGYQEGQQDAEQNDTGDTGDTGGDYGGGDYGGGDFGGGDFGGGDFGGDF